ncbi:hypothetical protein Spico_1791 [Parasphaerochaeta coccoides DSM 17374]|uniref:Nitroreductase n=1 Tax=Parasphaerochaeta coccoides (strain ATCC BAA-1237 / DSM 17374 / SPN1) TaxID=760011 RepID=F4GLU8_PARC1|nr:hypothetical protein Spico_1791 [Parasphaerochaeta coccoides DSM 17374]
MIWLNALLHGLVWSGIWVIALYVTFRLVPHTLIHNYPKELQELADIPIKSKRLTTCVSLLVWVVIIGYYLFAVLWTFRHRTDGFLDIMAFSFMVFMVWNICDLTIMDWLLFCTVQPSVMVLKGTKGHPAYKDYMFHFIGFLKGTGIAAIFAFVIGGISYLILNSLVW